MKKRTPRFLGVQSIGMYRITRLFILCLLLFALFFAFLAIQKQQNQAPTPVSPLIFGANIGLYNAQDSFLTQPSVRKLVRDMHIKSLRIPIRQAFGDTWLQALQDTKNLGLIPLLILPGDVKDEEAPATYEHIIDTVNSIMGNRRVFYEFRNEEDLTNGVDQYTYTARWNKFVPELKQLAPQAWFGGPVNYQRNAPYIAYFYHNAHPRPDFISWHSYFCNPQSSAQTCITNVTHLGNDIADTKDAMRANGDSVPPIFITEWNYDASQGANNDPRNTPRFQQELVKAVLQEFAKDGIYAAYHYVLNSNPAFNLINANNITLTSAGTEFEVMYKQLIDVKGAQQNAASHSP